MAMWFSRDLHQGLEETKWPEKWGLVGLVPARDLIPTRKVPGGFGKIL